MCAYVVLRSSHVVRRSGEKNIFKIKSRYKGFIVQPQIPVFTIVTVVIVLNMNNKEGA